VRQGLQEEKYLLVTDLLRSSGERFPENTAVIEGSRRITYKKICDKVEELAGYLVVSGMVPGERGLILLENSAEYIVAYFAIMRAGGIAVPIGSHTTGRGLGKILADCAPSVVIGRSERVRLFAPILKDSSSVRTVLEADAMEFEKSRSVPTVTPFQKNNIDSKRKEKDLALILYTSGTSGQPKGVVLTHRNLLANAASIVASLNLTSEDRAMAILPFHYSYGNSLLTTHVMVGASLVLENSFLFPNVVLDRIFQERATGFAGVPSTFAILLHRSTIRNHPLPSLRYVTQAGGAMSVELARDLRKAVSGTDVYIMYGQTEATARLTCLDPSDFLRKAGSVGKAIPGVRITLRKEDGTPAVPGEVGEIVAEGDNVMAGYWNSPGETASVLQDGCLRTGDLAHVDDEGFLYIVGRRSEMIKTGGHRVSPNEIEDVISAIPGILAVVAHGVQDKIMGEAIRVFVVRGQGVNVLENDVLKHCSENLEPFLVPRDIVFLDKLPRLTSGKVDRVKLKSLVI
jgi:long-chain acyl-CoA synthetase